ncbi:MAG: FAD:protein FMN transferase, partial [Verrucomicrobia bacterium]|nr:FAD:protein FMN transferase [Verrucomicrobiota bacterium]
FGLLEQARELHRATGGAFDITIAPLMRCWGFVRDTGHFPEPDELAAARAKVGMDLVEFNAADWTIRFRREGVMLDLGAIGKGYALECAAERLRDLEIASALLHGGTSTVYALGTQPDGQPWKVTIPHPVTGAAAFGLATAFAPAGHPAGDPPLAVVSLRDESLSVSAVWGKAFEADGRIYGHVLDPRTGAPVVGAVLAAVVLPSATETDALSTALLTLGIGGLETITALRPGARLLVAEPTGDRKDFAIRAQGISLLT